MVTTINARSNVDSLIPDNHIGNAIVFAATTYPRSPMLEQESSLFTLVKDLVFRAHKARKAVDDKQVKATITHVNASHDWASFTFKLPEMAFSNLRRTKVYELDFGSSLGNIERFEMPDPRIAGGCWILPARTVKEGPVA
ncbi:uncharacterized protein LDX57_007457 [Aspergillus melleus]|uniref:uncharacterized protein n=1 Tax=Aspergillus melleus TaxID=138277 RepID=UPI001E8D5F2E|nr:uncharacterized protein LDX57_007457 [Aspergillus melleus]KAH8429785.1 hypothetical protein LDX57_007457 [Aspergillus melleus]